MLFHDFEIALLKTQSTMYDLLKIDFYSSLIYVKWNYDKKKFSEHNVQTPVGFCRTLANFGLPMSDVICTPGIVYIFEWEKCILQWYIIFIISLLSELCFFLFIAGPQC